MATQEEIESKDLIFDPKTGEYVPKTISPELFRQMKETERRKAVTAGVAGIVGEAAQIGLGATVFGDPAIKAAQREKARLAGEIAKGPDYMSEQEKADFVAASVAPAERQAEASRRQVQGIAAATGRFDAGTLLRSMDRSIPEITQATLKAKSAVAAQDVAAQQIKAEADERNRNRIASVDQMMLNLRNEFIREPLHSFISNAAKLTGTLMAYSPAATIDDEVERLREAKVPDDQISDFIKTFRRKPRKGAQAADELIAKMKGEGVEVEETKTPPKPEPVMNWTDPSSGKFGGVEYRLGDDEKIRYKSPTTGKEIVVEKGTKAYDSIMEIRPEPKVPEEPMTADELRAGAEESLATAKSERQAADKAKADAEKAKADAAQAVYKQVTARVPGKQDALFRKEKDDGYAYGFKDNVWTVYQGRFPAQPVRRSGTNEPVTFTIEEAKNSKNPNVRELYDLAVANNLITFDTLF